MANVSPKARVRKIALVYMRIKEKHCHQYLPRGDVPHYRGHSSTYDFAQCPRGSRIQGAGRVTAVRYVALQTVRSRREDTTQYLGAGMRTGTIESVSTPQGLEPVMPRSQVWRLELRAAFAPQGCRWLGCMRCQRYRGGWAASAGVVPAEETRKSTGYNPSAGRSCPAPCAAGRYRKP